MKYTTDYYLKKFSKIPKHKWTSGDFEDHDEEMNVVARCAFGHCGANADNCEDSDDVSPVPEAHALALKFMAYLRVKVYDVNDIEHDMPGAGHRFRGVHPRTRILNALRHIKKIEKKYAKA